jgi:hypothetical protein
MVKRVFTIFLSIMLLTSFSLALAGGAPKAVAPAPYGVPCPPGKPYPAGPDCAFWGDAPFPGLCGGVVALPFLVVGSLLGGNTMGPGAYPPAPGYQCAPQPYPPKVYAPPPPAPCGPMSYAPTGYGPGGYESGILAGSPVFELCSGLLGGVTGGPSLLW